MPENRAYKLNKQKQPAPTEGKFLYYFYNHGILTSAEVTEEQFDKLISLDTAFYNNNRRAHDHKTSLARYMAQKHKKGPVSVEEKEDEELRLIQDDIIEQSDDAAVVATFSEEDQTIYSLCVEQHLTQTEAAKALGKSQSYIAKHMAKIEQRLALNYADTGERTKDEVYAAVQWEKYKEKQRTDDDEDMLWDMFLYLLPAEEEEEIKSRFHGDREFYKFGLTYIILRPFENCSDTDFWKRIATIPEHNIDVFLAIYDDQIEELRWLYLAICEEIEKRKKKWKEKPRPIERDKILQKAAKIGKRLNMTGEEFIEKRFIPKIIADKEKRYKDFRRKYKNIVVIDENDPRPMREQLIEIFGEGPEPVFRNPEFDDKK